MYSLPLAVLFRQKRKKTTLKSLNSYLNRLIIKHLHNNHLKCNTFQIDTRSDQYE